MGRAWTFAESAIWRSVPDRRCTRSTTRATPTRWHFTSPVTCSGSASARDSRIADRLGLRTADSAGVRRAGSGQRSLVLRLLCRLTDLVLAELPDVARRYPGGCGLHLPDA